jgi:5-methylcytosine-specific restriction endonuclease McrA
MRALRPATRPAHQAPEERRCAFCGKPEHQVEHLIASKHSVHICAECVALCAEIVAERRARDTTT